VFTVVAVAMHAGRRHEGDEALEAGTGVTLDAHGGALPRVDTEPTGSVPGEHVEGVELVEQPVGAEVPKHPPLNDARSRTRCSGWRSVGVDQRKAVDYALEAVAELNRLVTTDMPAAYQAAGMSWTNALKAVAASGG
jgi:hypothetical protein